MYYFAPIIFRIKHDMELVCYQPYSLPPGDNHVGMRLTYSRRSSSFSSINSIIHPHEFSSFPLFFMQMKVPINFLLSTINICNKILQHNYCKHPKQKLTIGPTSIQRWIPTSDCRQTVEMITMYCVGTTPNSNAVH